MTKLTDQFHAARKVSVPLIVIRTADPAATMDSLKSAAAVEGSPTPLLKWDIAQGVVPLNEEGKDALAKMAGNDDLEALQDPSTALKAALRLPPQSVLFFLNAHRYLTSEPSGAVVTQAIWNLRDKLKADRRTWVGLCPDIQLPPELQQDVLVLDEPLPTPEQLAEIIQAQYKAAGLPSPNGDVMPKAVEAVRGLAAYPVEQETAMCLTKNGLDLEALWERKRKLIESTRGLMIWRGKERLDHVRNQDNLVAYVRSLLKNVSVVLFLDEIEKMVAGAQGDTSGVSQAMHQYLLTYMSDKELLAILLIGPPGTGKSMLAKAAGNEANAPCISLDINGIKGSLVGESEMNCRNAFKVIDSVGGGRVLMVATCNAIQALSPELRSRFMDTFYVDLPGPEARAAMWKQYCKEYGLKQKRAEIDDHGWTGREIKNCCRKASLRGTSLEDAATYVVPVAVSAAERIEQLRTQASNRYIDAARSGIYRYDKTIVATAQRQVTLEQ